MIEIEVNKKNLKQFINSIRKTDKEELIALYGKSYKKKFIQCCANIKKYIYFIADDNYNPCAIGGACLKKNKQGKKIALVWLLSSIYAQTIKKSIFKYVKYKIDFFKSKFDVLYNYIYKSNFAALNWLKLLDFKVINLEITPCYKIFYFSREVINDTRYFAC